MDEFKPAMEAALAQTARPSVVVVKVDYSENVRRTNRLGRLPAR